MRFPSKCRFKKDKEKNGFVCPETVENVVVAPLIRKPRQSCTLWREEEGGRALERGRGLSPGGAISKWEPPAMTSPLSVNHLCLISPPGALQSKYQCGRPTKTVGRIKRITQAARVLHHRGAGLITRARRRDGGS